MAPRRGRHLQHAQMSAQAVQGYGHVHIEMSVSTPKSTTSAPSCLSTPPIARTCAAPSDIAFTTTTTGPTRRRTDDTVTGHLSGTLLLGHAPATGGYEATSRIDRRVTFKAHRARG